MKYLRYLKYIIKHKWYVFVECCKLGIPWRGITHDLSKFLPSEFFPYTEYFYGKGNQWGFDEAWLKHQHRNKHHWQYWVLINDDNEVNDHLSSNRGTVIVPMPLHYVKEMVADWKGAGKAIHGKDDTHVWYEENKNKIMIHGGTRQMVEYLLGVKR